MEEKKSKEKNISIKDIARLCNVSVPTVSRIINHSGRYSAETESKVRKVIAETGYQPSVFARGLRTNSTNNIGIIVPDITNEFFASITLEIQNTLFGHSYTAMICNTNEQPTVQAKQLEMLRGSRVSGIIFISGEEITEEDLTDGIPKVFVDRLPWNAASKDVVTIEVDNYTGGQLAAGTLLDAGCRHIVALFDARGLSTQLARYSGFIRAHQDRGVDVARDLYRPVTQVSFQEGYAAIKDLIERKVPFDGICCYTDTLASGAMSALAEAGISVPGQVQVTGYDDTSAAKWTVPALTTIAQPVKEMGRLAADTILKMSRNEKIAKKHYTLPVELIKRKSTTI
ncbi:LacI family DNA-binding transcriptional regulator [Mediterraneibacter sp. NSJ-55]|uniref:LacI family DNA-binding transcriptional regulator n=1 Tax=Mediterraneibacter hominis TaxID=2763054 RepID=A0A923LIQ3_9FIRM|nr:LacI family DNA-binding transcriptional regulator [Mediterraneibacter hominis]MBC5688999.1 LacI family DNA-binding transcriptional regulator [Mediterraneibacter hominis]